MGTRRIQQDEMLLVVTNLISSGVVVANTRLGPGESKDIPARHVVGKIDRCQAISTLVTLGHITVQVKYPSMGTQSVLVNAAYLLSLQAPPGAGVVTGSDVNLDPTGAIQIQSGSSLEKAMSGDIVFACDPATAGTSAAVLNAALAGEFTKTIKVNMQDAADVLHTWASIALNAVATEVVVDVDVAAPAVDDATPDLVAGTVDVVLTYDTDANVTKTYAIGDTVTLTISEPTGGILGYPIGDATFVDTIVA